MTIKISSEVLKGSRRAVNRGRTGAVLVDAGRFTIVHQNELRLDGDEGKKNAGLVVTLADKEASGSNRRPVRTYCSILKEATLA